VTSALTQPETSVADATQPPRHASRRYPLVLVAIALIVAIVAALGGYELAKRHHPTFRSQAAISLDQPLKIAASTNEGEVDKLARLRTTYIGVVRFDSVVDAVAKEVKLSRGQVRARVFAAADPSSLLLIVGANDRTQPGARRVATALANEMIVYIQQQQDKYKIPDKDRITATMVVTPQTASQVTPTKRKELTTGIVAGLIVFLVIYGVGSLFRRPTP
jgi:capsular polysaccharide biosynthesis protein